ncbi:MAG: sigma 54-interacting transcriptional regulator, partial [Alkaliphilus sp.]|nr:sigma 54-interacting transcriptional regulator [Alkaliphilus sp.]
RKGKSGIFELADGGTVFLDEIADLQMSMQAKLLRVLQENEIRRVGGETTKKVDVRVVSATNKDLKKMMEEGKFREDLFFRLNVIEINLPPLRERGTDIDLFINKFLTDLSLKTGRKKPAIQIEALNLLRKYKWKGNVRELRNTIEQLFILCNDGVIRVGSIPQYIRDALKQPVVSALTDSMDLNEVVKEIECRTIKKALELTAGNKAAAAKLLNVKRTTLHYKIEQYKLND